jgi:hypothetical protein
MPLPEARPVFFHEYAHLIQDSTTIYGINDFLSFHDVIQDFSRVTEKYNSVTDVPLSESDTFKHSWSSFLYKYKKCVYPTTDWSSKTLWAFDSFQEEIRTISYNSKEFDVPIIKARFIDNTGCNEPIIHEIGIREIKESYSMAVENLHSEKDYDYDGLNEFQYAVIERILLKEFGTIDNNGIIAICHWSLNSLHPAVELTEIISDIKQNCCSLDWRDLYCFLRKRFLHHNNYLINNIRQAYSQILLNQATTGTNDMLYKAYKWYSENILKNLELIANEKSYFPIDTALCDSSANLKDFMQRFPIWLYEAGEEVGYTIASEDVQPDFVYFFRSLADVIYNLRKNNTQWKCILYQVCEHREEICLNQPWKRNSEPKCNYFAACCYLNLTNNKEITHHKFTP